jgi:hypothetical protein
LEEWATRATWSDWLTGWYPLILHLQLALHMQSMAE